MNWAHIGFSFDIQIDSFPLSCDLSVLHEHEWIDWKPSKNHQSNDKSKIYANYNQLPFTGVLKLFQISSRLYSHHSRCAQWDCPVLASISIRIRPVVLQNESINIGGVSTLHCQCSITLFESVRLSHWLIDGFIGSQVDVCVRTNDRRLHDGTLPGHLSSATPLHDERLQTGPANHCRPVVHQLPQRHPVCSLHENRYSHLSRGWAKYTFPHVYIYDVKQCPIYLEILYDPLFSSADDSDIQDSAFCAMFTGSPGGFPLWEVSTCVFFVIPMAVIMVLYVRIGLRIRSRTKHTQALGKRLTTKKEK